MPTINLEDKEFITLIKMVGLADFVANGACLPDEQNHEYRDLKHRLLSLQNQINIDDLDDESYEVVQKHIDTVLNSELTTRLVERDLENEFDKNDPSQRDKMFERHDELEDMYEKEFEENGLKNLIVSK